MTKKSTDKGQMARSAGVVGLFTLLSRVLGLVRDAVVAATFAKRATDAFFVAFTIPNVLRRLLAEGSLTVAFIPVFTEIREKEGEDRARVMLSNMLGATLVVLLLVVVVVSPERVVVVPSSPSSSNNFVSPHPPTMIMAAVIRIII